MPWRTVTLCSAGLLFLAVVCHVAFGSDTDDKRTTTHAITVEDNGSSLPDFDGDGTVGFGDFVIFAGVFGARQGDEKYEAKYDLNGDGEIGFSDFVIFAQNFGKEAPSPVVAIPDPNLRTAIESALNKDSGAPITQAEMATLDSLEASDADISDLAGLEYATNLTWLDLASNDITSVSVLEGLTNLAHLILSSNNVTDLAGLVANTGLGTGDTVDLADNPLNVASQSTHIPALQARGVRVSFVPSPSVTIPDANLRTAIEAALGKTTGAPITQAGMAELVSLTAVRKGISDLTGLEYATNLTGLDLGGNDILVVSPLTDLNKLASLELWSNEIMDISPLSGLKNLKLLGLWSNNLTDVSALAGLTNLSFLRLGGNNLSDVSALSALENLSSLDLRGNNITDISPLSGLTNLESLNLSGNKFTNISVLAGLINLRSADLNLCNISDVSVLADLINLERLELSFNNITDVSPLSGLSNLWTLALIGSNLTDLAPLSNLHNLRSLFLNGNNVSDVSALSNLTNLTWLVLGNNLGGNMITDASAFSYLTNLRRLSLAFNTISDISALTGLTHLKELDLRGNPLSDSSINEQVPILVASGVSVDYHQIHVGDFDIELVFVGPFADGYKNLLQFAARRWMSVIKEDLPDYIFTEGWSGVCGDQSYVISSGERIDDLRIYVASNFEPENPHGWASATVVRETTFRPALGCMVIRFGGYNTATNVWITGLHELGHVFGFTATHWNKLGFLQDPSGDPHFNGPLAIAAFDSAGGRDYNSAKVPSEKGGGSHWRWPVLRGELMVSGGGGALSAITVQSLADLGYGVDVTQADAYTLPGATAGAKIALSLPPASRTGVDSARDGISPPQGADLYGQGRTSDGPSSILGDGRTGRQESAERVWGHGVNVNLWENRQTWGTGSPAHVEPELTCGAGLMNEPIYVIDPQGRIVRTIHR